MRRKGRGRVWSSAASQVPTVQKEGKAAHYQKLHITSCLESQKWNEMKVWDYIGREKRKLFDRLSFCVQNGKTMEKWRAAPGNKLCNHWTWIQSWLFHTFFHLILNLTSTFFARIINLSYKFTFTDKLASHWLAVLFVVQQVCRKMLFYVKHMNTTLILDEHQLRISYHEMNN